jgi:hypothetical protein
MNTSSISRHDSVPLPTDKRFDVYPYHIDKLKWLLAREAKTDLAIVEDKVHCIYFEEYFETLGAKTIVAERNYVDHDFLDDFTGYYVRCFKSYRRWCTRLHFFRVDLGEDAFEAILKNPARANGRKWVRENYLGFVVVKPLPKTIIGRTCLKTFPHEGRRHYPITRGYVANLFGWNLEVCSLAFQEQDKVVAACATSALWSVLQGTGKLFHHHIPSPVEITKLATEFLAPVPPETRNLPSCGLSIGQMARAIEKHGLEPFYINPENAQVLKNTVYAYLRGRIPILMVAVLLDYCDGEPVRPRRGTHAVAVTGYSLGNREPIPLRKADDESDLGFLSKASRIDKLYVHDDQVGPFVRMGFHSMDLDLEMPGDLSERWRYFLSTSWRCGYEKTGNVRAMPLALMVPLYHMIRIPYDTIQEVVVVLDRIIEGIREAQMTSFAKRLEWDIHLTSLNDFKTDMRRTKSLKWQARREVLVKELPWFMWRAMAYSEDRLILDLLFDATDIEQGSLLSYAIGHQGNLFEILKFMAQHPETVKKHKTKPEWKVLEWFSKLPKN